MQIRSVVMVGALGLVCSSSLARQAVQCPSVLVAFGAGEPGESGGQNFGQSEPPDEALAGPQVSAGIYHVASLLANGRVVCWGRNYSGCVFGTNASGRPILSGVRGQAVQILGVPLMNVAEVRAGELHTVARRVDGSVVAWGANSHGQLQVPAGLIATRIDVGSLHTLALRPDGSIAAWGTWSAGGPTQTGFVDVAAGYEHSLARREDGSFVAWGRNDYGQANVPSPLPASREVDGGTLHSILLGHDGIVRAWGDNRGGQCGGTNADGTLDTTPGQHLRVVKRLGQPLGDVVAISAGGYHGVALLADGSAHAWGAGLVSEDWVQGQTNVPSMTSGLVLDADAGYLNTVLRVSTSAVDCDASGGIDCVEIAVGAVSDSDADGIPDPCEVDPCPGDITGGGQVNGVDLAAVLGAWGTDGQGKLDCDINADGTVDAQDLAIVLGGWGPCPG